MSCHDNEELPHLHLLIKGDCRTFEGPPFFTQSNPDCRIDKARVSDIKQAVKDRCGDEDGTPFQQSIWRGDFDIYWNGNKLDDDLFLEGITSEKSEKSIKLAMYSTVNVVLREATNKAEHKKPGGKTRKGRRKGRRKIERSTTFRNKR